MLCDHSRLSQGQTCDVAAGSVVAGGDDQHSADSQLHGRGFGESCLQRLYRKADSNAHSAVALWAHPLWNRPCYEHIPINVSDLSEDAAILAYLSLAELIHTGDLTQV